MTRAAGARRAAAEDHRLAKSPASHLTTEERTGFARMFVAADRAAALGLGPLRSFPLDTPLAPLTIATAMEWLGSGTTALSSDEADHVSRCVYTSAPSDAHRPANGEA